MRRTPTHSPQHSTLQVELLKIGSPAAFHRLDEPTPVSSRRPIRCAICKVLATNFLAIGHWFEDRAGSPTPMELDPRA
jgi:hypothetical protein